MQRQLGAQAEVVDSATLARLAPGLRVDDLSCAAWEDHGGYGDGAVVAGDLLAAAREGGVRYRARTAVSSLLIEHDRVIGVQTAEGPEYAGTVVVAAGVWSPALMASAGVRLPIEYEFHQVAVLKHRAGTGASVGCIDSTTQTYFRPEGSDETTLVGSFTGQRLTDPDGAPARADPEELAATVESASRRVPALAESGIVRGVTGVYDMTPDARPLLGEVPGLDGVVLAAGFSGMGFKISPAVGEAIAEIVMSGAGSRLDVKAFRPSRFDEGEPICSPYPYSDD
jgi:glycine/D-amino acid oxidase-like deaminating enzyme